MTNTINQPFVYRQMTPEEKAARALEIKIAGANARANRQRLQMESTKNMDPITEPTQY